MSAGEAGRASPAARTEPAAARRGRGGGGARIRPEGAGRGCGARPPRGRGGVCRGARGAALRERGASVDRGAARRGGVTPSPALLPAPASALCGGGGRRGPRGRRRRRRRAWWCGATWKVSDPGRRRDGGKGGTGHAQPGGAAARSGGGRARSAEAGRAGALAGHRGCPRAAWRPGALVARRPPGYVTVTSLPASTMARPARPLTGRPAEAARDDGRRGPAFRAPGPEPRTPPGPAPAAPQTPSPAPAPRRPFSAAPFIRARVCSLVRGAARGARGGRAGLRRCRSSPPSNIPAGGPSIGSEYVKTAFVHLFFLLLCCLKT